MGCLKNSTSLNRDVKLNFILSIVKNINSYAINSLMDEQIIYYETNFWKVMLHPNQAYLGYSIIILKREADSLSNLKKEEWDNLQKIIKKLESAYKKTFNATMFNWTCLLNNAYKKDPPKPQVHFQMRPRYKQKVKINKDSFEDLEFAHHYNKKRMNVVLRKTLELIAKKIYNIDKRKLLG